MPGVARTAKSSFGPGCCRAIASRPLSASAAESDVALVHTFAQQAGLAVRNVGLTRELARQTEELAASRDQLVRAQDAERRRISSGACP